jgi:hypothetical protein
MSGMSSEFDNGAHNDSTKKNKRRRSQTDKNIRTWVKVSKLRAAYNKLRGSDQQPEMGRCVMGRAT